MNLALLLGLLTVTAPTPQAPPAQDAVPARVEGVIQSVRDGRRIPLPYALVELVIPAHGRSTMADSTGAYHLDGVRAGRHRLRVIHVGYEPIEVEVLVPPAGTVEMDLVLRQQAVPLPALRVVAGRPHTIEIERGTGPEGTPTAGLLGLRALETSPGLVESGLGDAVRSVPGNEPRDPTDVLLMRGSTADLKLVLLDGAPVYAPFHTGGLFPGFQLSTLGTATHHVGGAPARYDGGLSYVLDLRTRPARTDRVRASGSLDVLGMTGALEAPLGPTGGVMAAARGLHGASGWLAGGEGSPYGYGELLVRGDVGLGRGGHLSATGFTNRETVHLDRSASGGAPPLDDASWGNDAVSLSWVSPVGRWADLEIGVASTAYRAELPVTVDAADDDEDGPTSSVHVASGTTKRTRLTADLRLPGVADGLRAGASLDRTEVAYGSRSADGISSITRAPGSVLGAYVDRLHDLGGEFDLRYGMRLDRFDPGGVRSALRLAVLWSLGPDALLTVAGGRYHQLARLGDNEVDLVLGDALGVGTAPEAATATRSLLQTATADHLTLSLEHGVTPEVRLAFQGYLKRFRGLDSSDSPGLASSGADLTVVRDDEATTAWLGYSLAWFWEQDSTSGAFSGRQLLSAGLRGDLLGPVGVDLRASFSDGLPLTAVAIDREDSESVHGDGPAEGDVSPFPSTREADGFLRIDAEVFARWTREWGSRSWEIRPYVKILNALDRRDGLFYYFEPWRSDDLRPLAELSLIPVVGLEWRF